MLMFVSTHKEIIADLEDRIESLERALRVATNVDHPDVSASFDFVGKAAFSIEREKSSRRTVIGFRKQTGEEFEDEYWYADTTDEVHLDLVARFNAALEV